MKRDQGVRLIELLKLLSQDAPLTAKQLAAALDTNVQNVNEDLKNLRNLGVKFHNNSGRTPKYQLLYPWHTEQKVENDPVQAVIIHALVRLLHHHAPTPSKAYSVALRELSAKLPPKLQKVSQKALNPIQGDVPSTLEKLAAAWCWGQMIEFLYQKPTEPQPRWRKGAIAFMEISRSNLDWYVMIQQHGEPKVKTFHLSRFHDVRRLADAPSPEIEFDPKKELADAWGIIGGQHRCLITLKFRSEAVPHIVYRTWPGEKEREFQLDGSLLLKINAPKHNNGLPLEVMAWIRGWGARAEIISPQWLRAQWIREAGQIAALGQAFISTEYKKRRATK